MSLKNILNNLFNGKPSVSPSTDRRKLREQDREKLKDELTNNKVEAEVQKENARRNILAARMRAIDAIHNGDLNGKAIAFREIKVNLGVYRYMQSIQSAIAIMESNFRMNEVTESFATMVNRIGRLKIPQETIDFGELTKKAMNGLAVPDINGLNGLVDSLLSSSAQNMQTSDSDAWIEEFVNNESMTVDQIQQPVLSAVQSQPAINAPAAEQETDMELEDLMGLLNAMNTTKK